MGRIIPRMRGAEQTGRRVLFEKMDIRSRPWALKTTLFVRKYYLCPKVFFVLSVKFTFVDFLGCVVFTNREKIACNVNVWICWLFADFFFSFIGNICSIFDFLNERWSLQSTLSKYGFGHQHQHVVLNNCFFYSFDSHLLEPFNFLFLFVLLPVSRSNMFNIILWEWLPSYNYR